MRIHQNDRLYASVGSSGGGVGSSGGGIRRIIGSIVSSDDSADVSPELSDQVAATELDSDRPPANGSPKPIPRTITKK
jgi:hypothetical protein